MRIKKKLFYPIISLMVLLTLFNTSQTYAYWSVSQLNATINETIIIGEWNQIYEWVSGTTYNLNDVVTLNGITYISLKANNTKTPGANGSGNFWSVV